MKIFSERLKELRIEKNLNQSELARKTGLSQSSIARWEADDRDPTIHGVIVLAKFFGVSIDFLVGLEEY